MKPAALLALVLSVACAGIRPVADPPRHLLASSAAGIPLSAIGHLPLPPLQLHIFGQAAPPNCSGPSAACSIGSMTIGALTGTNGIAFANQGARLLLGPVSANDYISENASGGIQLNNRVFFYNGTTMQIAVLETIQDSNASATRLSHVASASSIITGDAADSATGVAVKLNNRVALTVNGAHITDFQSNSISKGFVDLNGLMVSFNPLRRQASYQTIANADTAFTAVGIGTATLLGGITATADTTNTAYQMLKYTTGAVSGNPAGVSGPFTTTEATYLPLFHAVVLTDPAAVTSTRVFVGLVASSLDQVATLAASNGVKYCAFRFDTGLADATWKACSSDGTTASCTDTTVTYSAATTYRLTIDNTVSGTCDFYVNGASKVNKTTNINATSTAQGVEASITTLTTAARSLSLSKLMLLQN